METTVLKLAAELCGAGEEDVLLQALCDAAETFWKTRVQPGTAAGSCGAPRLLPRRRTIWARTAPGASPSLWGT